MATATVLSGPERRRRWSASEKLRIVKESASGKASIAEIARRHDVHPNLVHAWRRQARTGVLVPGPGEGTALAGAPGFVPVTIAASDTACPIEREASIASVIEVMLRNGRVLRLSERIAPGRVALLADALEGCMR